MDMIATLTASIGTQRGLDPSMFAEGFKERGGVVITATIDENGKLHPVPFDVSGHMPIAFLDPSCVPVQVGDRFQRVALVKTLLTISHGGTGVPTRYGWHPGLGRGKARE